MTYAAELWDSCRQQLRHGYASNELFFWPKIPAAGNVTVTPASYEVHKPGDGPASAPIQSGSATIDNSAGYSRVSAVIDCSNTSLWQLNIRGYWALWTWTYAGTVRTTPQIFDVVRDPWLPSVSLNDLMADLPDIRQRCSAQAQRLVNGRTAEQHAAEMAVKAWGDVWEWLEKDFPDRLPSMLLPKEYLHKVIVAQAIHRIYLGEGGAPGTSEAMLADLWETKARQRYKNLPDLWYSAGDNRAPIERVEGFSVTHATRGRW